MHLIYQQQWAQDLSKQIIHYLQDNLDWIGIPSGVEDAQKANLSLLDYACGFGLVTYSLLPWFTKIRGIDISDNNVDKYNKQARDQGISPDQVFAVQGDARSPAIDLASSEFSKFDFIIISMALHHIDDPKALLSCLLTRLRPGGHIFIVDWTPEHYGVPKRDANHLIARTPGVSVDGFSQETMMELMSSVGFEGGEYRLHPKRSSMGDMIGGEKQLFFARGMKPL
ncbi:methyltransferase domain-containing protein [Fusarium austroafricanum]|uniref:Methyltransferase domain-containing protein n=1 Tax=Fusarium austroafricanum TaxID=2364996 RepID=A0A8H4KVH6_9HYPO|nr:methyltransferase domain-containing protein [Fusarium austroafricanum]